MKILCRLLVGIAVLNFLFGADSQGGFVLTDLGGGNAYGLNASGQVAGQNAAGHAFLYSNGTMHDLGTLGGTHSLALAINSSGDVVGWANSTGTATSQGFLYRNGVMIGLSPAAISGGAQGINASGQVTGWYSNSGTTATGALLGPNQAFMYSNGTVDNLGTFPAGSDTFPLSINASEGVVGYTYQPGITGEQPFLIQNGTTTIFGFSGAFQMINDGGVAVGGHYLSDTVRHAVQESSGTVNDLGTLGGSNSWAYGVNNSGAVVGDAYTASGADHAFLYSNGKMTDLDSLIDPNSGWTLQVASAINDDGQIVGWGVNANGQSDAFLLSPVPEPGALIIWSSIAAMFSVGRLWTRAAISMAR